MNIAQPDSAGPRLSEVDFEEPTGIVWPILALAALRSDLNRYDADHHPTSWGIYSATLNEACTLFGVPGSLFNWSVVPRDGRKDLIQRLAETCAAFNAAYATGPQEEAFCRYLLRWFETYSTRIDFDESLRLAGMPDHTQVFTDVYIRSAVAGMLWGLTGTVVERHLAALRAVPTVASDAIDQVRYINILYLGEAADAILEHLRFKIGREYLGSRRLPIDLTARVLGPIEQPLAEYVILAYADFIRALEHGKGKFSEDDAEHTKVCMESLFFAMGRAFSYQSQLFHIDDEEDDDDEEQPVPEHVVNHQYDQYQDHDWYAREYRPVETQPDVLLGPQTVGLDEVSVEFDDDQQSCALCDDSSQLLKLNKLKVCGHIICQDCLASQLNAVHQCRYKCAYCRAEFF